MPRRCKNDFSGDLPSRSAQASSTIRSGLFVLAYVGFLFVAALPTRARGSDPAKYSIDSSVKEILARTWAKECEELESKLQYAQGTLKLANGLVTLELPPGFRFLNHDQTVEVLRSISRHRLEKFENGAFIDTTDINTAEGMLGFRCDVGMICLSDVSPLSERNRNIIVHYNHCGHISDERAGQIDFREVLQDRQELSPNTKGISGLFSFMGRGTPPQIIDWARVPRYDVVTHQLCWADETKVFNSGEHELWYHACLLGRTGAFEMTAIAPMSRLTDTEAAVEQIMAGAKFNPSWRYEDYVPRDDKSAGSMEVILLGARSWQAKWLPWVMWLVGIILFGVVAPILTVWTESFLDKRYPGTWWTRPIFGTLFDRDSPR